MGSWFRLTFDQSSAKLAHGKPVITGLVLFLPGTVKCRKQCPVPHVTPKKPQVSQGGIGYVAQ